MSATLLTFPAVRVHSSPALETNSAGRGNPRKAANQPQDVLNAAFLSPKVRAFNGGPGGAAARLAGAFPVFPPPFGLPPSRGKEGCGNQTATGKHIMNNQSPAVFNFNSNEVRVVVCDGEPWFVCTDVAKALHYRDAEVASRHLDDDEKGVHPTGVPGQNLTIINESGLYALVLRSRKPEARKFAKWVTSEVLPAIRKTGAYATVTVDAESAPKKIAPPVISDYLQLHINRKTHEIALGQYDAIRGIITEAVQSNLNCGATESAAHDYVDTYGDAASEVIVMNKRDVFMLARQTTGLLNCAGEALETIHRLEKHIRQELYSRKQPDKYGCYGLPESLVESVISAAQERKAA